MKESKLEVASTVGVGGQEYGIKNGNKEIRVMNDINFLHCGDCFRFVYICQDY